MKYLEENQYNLQARYDTRNSFYGKAKIKEFIIGDKGTKTLHLYSYLTHVATVEINSDSENKAYILGKFSQTTTRHQKEFLKQNGFKAESIKQMLEDYGVDKNV